MPQIKVIIEQHEDGFVAYPIGMKGMVVADGDSYEQALENVRSAISFHRESFGEDSMTLNQPLNAFPADA